MRSQFVLFVFLLMVFLFATSACSKDDNEQDDYELGGVEIKMWENIDAVPRTLQLRCETRQIFPCCNWGITHTVNVSSEAIDIRFKDIYIPDICLTATGPATAHIDLGSLSEGTYNLNLSAPGSHDSGSLIVNDDYYKLSLNFPYSSRLAFPYDQLNRIPENTIWGHVGYHSEDTEPLVDSFIDDLREKGAEPDDYLHGEYGYFRILNTGEIETSKYHGYHLIEPFIFDYQDDMSSVEELVKYYGLNHGDDLNISVFTCGGERFLSWTYSAECL